MLSYKIITAATLLGLSILLPLNADADEIKPLTQQLRESEAGKWISVWGQYGFEIGVSSLETGTSFSNQLGLGVRVKPASILTLDMSTEYLYADRLGDSNAGFSTGYDSLGMHRAYATLDILDKKLRLSGGRRPYGESVPLSALQNKDQIDDRGNPSLLSNFHFDGGVISYSPEILSSVGSYWQIMYGHGYGSDSLAIQSALSASSSSLFDSDIFGATLVAVSTSAHKIWFQWNRAFDVFDFPVVNNTAFGNTTPSTALGDIDWFSVGAKTTFKAADFGDLHFFVDGGMSVTRPNGNLSTNGAFTGLLSGSPFSPESPKEKTGYAVFTGVRYDLPFGTKIGFEYNYGSKYWITSSAAVVGKTGTRGNVYEPFVMQEINVKPVTSLFAKTFVRAGFQYYDFEYTGSNSWVGAPVKISDITSGILLLQAPVTHSRYVYGALEIHF